MIIDQKRIMILYNIVHIGILIILNWNPKTWRFLKYYINFKYKNYIISDL